MKWRFSRALKEHVGRNLGTKEYPKLSHLQVIAGHEEVTTAFPSRRRSESIKNYLLAGKEGTWLKEREQVRGQ